MSPTRALPAIMLVAALASAVSAAPAAPAPPSADRASSTSAPSDAPDSIDKSTSPGDEEVRYPAGASEPEREGWGSGSGRIFSQLVMPLVQLVVNQLLQATNLVGALAGAGAGGGGAGAGAGGARPNLVLSLLSAALGASSGGGEFPPARPAPPVS